MIGQSRCTRHMIAWTRQAIVCSRAKRDTRFMFTKYLILGDAASWKIKISILFEHNL